MTTKFVILCQPRTGSCLLQATLGRHPQILKHGEILNHRYQGDLPDEGYQRLVTALNRNSHAAIGCKLHAFQPDRNWDGWRQWEPAWDALADDVSIKIVHLQRLDAIGQLASWKIADILKNWGSQSDATDRPTVQISPYELRWFREWNRVLFEWRLSRLSQHEILPITYESLCEDWDTTIRRVQEFVGVEPFLLQQALRKNETRPLTEVVKNYNELEGV